MTLPTALPSATQRRAAATSSRLKLAPMWGCIAPEARSSRSSASLRPVLAGCLGGEVPELEAQDLDALEQHQVQGDPRDRCPRRSRRSRSDRPSAGTCRAGSAERTSDRVDDDVRPLGQRLFEGLPEVRRLDGR